MVLRLIRGDANQPVVRFTCDQIGGRALSAVGFARTDVSSANTLVTKFVVGRLLRIAGVACEWDEDCVTLLGNGLSLHDVDDHAAGRKMPDRSLRKPPDGDHPRPGRAGP